MIQMEISEIQKWKARAEKAIVIYKSNGYDPDKAVVSINANKFLDIINTCLNAKEGDIDGRENG